MAGHPVSLLVEGAVKRFGTVTALDNVTFSVARGEVHALIGENGAGKSTLLKILSGVEAPDAGRILLDGQETSFANPAAARNAGIATIHQEFSLFPDLSVWENLFTGHLTRNRLGLIDRQAMRRRAREALDRLGIDLDLDTLASTLSVAERQLIEIARALTTQARVIIMDEPTAALGGPEVERLAAVIADFKVHGVSVIFVSHRLEEILALTGRFTVLRDGRVAGTGRIADVHTDDLVRLMVGRDVERIHGTAGAAGEAVLTVKGLSSPSNTPGKHRPQVKAADLQLRRGEIVGIAGLVGAGRSELARMIFGADPVGEGKMTLGGLPYAPRSPRDAIAAGIGFVPEDRKLQSLFLEMSVAENFALPGKRSLALNRRLEREELEHFRRDLAIRHGGAGRPVETLSGGNQQKVILARWLSLKPRVLIVDEPTRGVDIAAKADVHHLLRRIAGEGVAVMVISSELSEVIAVSDRILTLRAGRITAEFIGNEINEERLMRHMVLTKAA